MNDVANEAGASGKNRSLLIALILLVLIAAGIGGWYYFERGPGQNIGELPNEGEGGEVVARVDGVEISRGAYERNLQQLQSAYAAQGIDASSATSTELLKEQALQSLINRQLILAAAKRENYSVSDEAVEAEYQGVIQNAGGAEALSAAMTAAGLSEAMVRTDLEEGLLIQQYLDNKVGVKSLSVTDAEVEAYYNEAKKNNTEVPPLADVSAVIKEQLLAQKQEAAINASLEGLRGGAKIEILI